MLFMSEMLEIVIIFNIQMMVWLKSLHENPLNIKEIVSDKNNAQCYSCLDDGDVGGSRPLRPLDLPVKLLSCLKLKCSN